MDTFITPLMIEETYSPRELAARLRLSPDFIRTQFIKRPGVVRVGRGSRLVMRIPKSVAEAWIKEHTVKEKRR